MMMIEELTSMLRRTNDNTKRLMKENEPITIINRFRESQAGKCEPACLTIKDCSDSGWLVTLDFLHHDGNMELGKCADTDLATALKTAIGQWEGSLPALLGNQ
jgi:hypothetical protein